MMILIETSSITSSALYSFDRNGIYINSKMMVLRKTSFITCSDHYISDRKIPLKTTMKYLQMAYCCLSTDYKISSFSTNQWIVL